MLFARVVGGVMYFLQVFSQIRRRWERAGEEGETCALVSPFRFVVLGQSEKRGRPTFCL